MREFLARLLDLLRDLRRKTSERRPTLVARNNDLEQRALATAMAYRPARPISATTLCHNGKHP